MYGEYQTECQNLSQTELQDSSQNVFDPQRGRYLDVFSTVHSAYSQTFYPAYFVRFYATLYFHICYDL